VIDDLPKEWRDKWYELVPGGRFADAAELKGVCSGAPSIDSNRIC
jgi:hypothetical protein